jgi:hypothetical protein
VTIIEILCSFAMKSPRCPASQSASPA